MTDWTQRIEELATRVMKGELDPGQATDRYERLMAEYAAEKLEELKQTKGDPAHIEDIAYGMVTVRRIEAMQRSLKEEL